MRTTAFEVERFGVTALFRNARDAVRAEMACRTAGLQVAVVPPPREISAECGMALRIEDADRTKFEILMKTNDIHVAIHE